MSSGLALCLLLCSLSDPDASPTDASQLSDAAEQPGRLGLNSENEESEADRPVSTAFAFATGALLGGFAGGIAGQVSAASAIVVAWMYLLSVGVCSQATPCEAEVLLFPLAAVGVGLMSTFLCCAFGAASGGIGGFLLFSPE